MMEPTEASEAASEAASKPARNPSKNSFATAYHPEFMFCGSCTTCSPENSSGNNSIGNQPPPQLMSMLTKVPMRRKKKGPIMTYVPAGKMNIIKDDREMNTDEDRDCGDIELTDSDDTSSDEDLVMREKEHAQLYISNLTTESQVLLINSVFDVSSGVSEVSTYLGDENEIKRKTVNLTYDPIKNSLDSMVKSLQDLGLDTSVTNASKRSHSSRRGLGAVAANAPETKSRRSTLHVEGICCATEVPQVTSILRRLGVEKVSINITSRMVYVDHYPQTVKASDLASALNVEGFGATVKRDGGRAQLQRIKSDASNAGESTAESSAREELPAPAPIFVESTLMCPSLADEEEVELINATLERCGFLYGKVRHVSPNVPSRTIKIEHDPKLICAQNVADALMDNGGYTNVTVLTDGHKEHLVLPTTLHVDTEEQELDIRNWPASPRLRRFRSCLPKGLTINIVLSGIFWVVSLAGALVEKWSYLNYAGLLSVFFGLPPVAKKAFRTLRRKHFDANAMMVTAALGAMFLQEYDEAASVSFLFSISEYLEDRATEKARMALDGIVKMRPDHANLIEPKTGKVIIVPVSDLEIGSLVSVRTGDQIPSDGVIVEGSSQIDESSLTGESVLIPKQAGDAVCGGTINAGITRLVVRTTSLVEDSAMSRLIALVEESASNRSPTEQIVDTFAKTYTPTVICFALLMCTIPWFFGVEEGRHWTLNGLILVIVACPCAITISTPVTYAAGLAATAQKGIIVKGGARLEALGSVKTVVFDKTGTLTEGKFRLNHLDVIGTQRTRNEVLALLSIMEAPSSHPLAATLVKAAEDEGVQRPKDTKVIGHSILKGEGVTAIVNGEEVYVGNEKLFQRLGLFAGLGSEPKNKAEDWNVEGGTVGFIGITGVGIVGMFCVADGVRPEARSAVSALINDGKTVMMLTGDGDGAAKAVAREVGLPLESVRSQFLPEDKLHCISSMLGLARQGNLFSKKELLLFVGDGVNDAPALAVADIGVAMGEGAALALEMSDVTLMDSNLSKLLYSIKMGTKVTATVKENIAFSVAMKLIVIALSFAGKMTLLAAIASDVGVMLIVSINGMKLLGEQSRMCCKQRNRYRQLEGQQQLEGEIV